MIHGLYQSAAGMMAQEYRQDVLANNLANAETAGFKREIAVFAERKPAAVAGLRRGPSDESLAALSGGLWLGRTHTDFSEGPFVRTENPLDVALEGPGFLMVESGGRRLFTRDGRMMTDARGQLRAVADAAPILNPAGGPIFVNPLGGRASIDTQGFVTQDGQIVGRLALKTFPDLRLLTKAGVGRFAADESQAVDSLARVHAGFVENAGVEPVKELAGMMECSRAYQINAQMITLQDQTIGRAISLVAR